VRRSNTEIAASVGRAGGRQRAAGAPPDARSSSETATRSAATPAIARRAKARAASSSLLRQAGTRRSARRHLRGGVTVPEHAAYQPLVPAGHSACWRSGCPDRSWVPREGIPWGRLRRGRGAVADHSAHLVDRWRVPWELDEPPRGACCDVRFRIAARRDGDDDVVGLCGVPAGLPAQRREVNDDLGDLFGVVRGEREEWAVPGSNGRPPACKARADAAVYCRLSLNPLRKRSRAADASATDPQCPFPMEAGVLAPTPLTVAPDEPRACCQRIGPLLLPPADAAAPRRASPRC
jgi:hypothetical protein